MNLWTAIAGTLGEEKNAFNRIREGKIDPSLTNTISWKAVDKLIAESSFEPGLIKLVPATDIDPSIYMRLRLGAGDIIERSPRQKPFLDLLRRGATLVINKANRSVPELRHIVELLEYSHNEIAWVNGYAGWTSTSAFGRHSDSHNTVIVQVEGNKHWRIYRGAGPEAEVVLDRVLEPGDVLQIPLGWEHEVTGIGSETLHWTFGMSRTTETEAFTGLLNFGLKPEHLTTLDNDARYDLFLRLRGELSAERRPGMSLPWSISHKTLTLTTVRWAGRFRPSLQLTDGRVILRGLGKAVKLPSSAAPLARAFIDGGSISLDGQPPEIISIIDALLHAGLVITSHE